MCPSPIIFLFDVDMTLVDTGGAGRRAFGQVFAEELGVEDAFRDYDFMGKVDRAIVQEVYGAAFGAPASPEVQAAIEDGYLARLETELRACAAYRVLPGVRELLETLAARPDCRLGLATGNYERGARLKLRRGGIDGYFETGGFGSDSPDRAELTRIGIQRLTADHGGPAPRRVFVVGDTPLDIRAAHAAGAEAIAVATGGYSADQLAAHRPALLLAELTDWPSWLPPLLGD